MQADYIEKCIKQVLLKEDHRTNYILLEDFLGFFNSPNLPFQRSNDLKSLSSQAFQLIYYRIWENNGLKQFTIETLAEFIAQNKNKKKRELMRKFITEVKRGGGLKKKFKKKSSPHQPLAHPPQP